MGDVGLTRSREVAKGGSQYPSKFRVLRGSKPTASQTPSQRGSRSSRESGDMDYPEMIRPPGEVFNKAKTLLTRKS